MTDVSEVEILGLYHPVEDAFELAIGKAIRVEDEKVLKLVRTVAGMRRYRQDKGSIIIKDGQAPLDGLIAVENDVPGYEKISDRDGNFYYIGLENGKWVVRNPKDNSLMYESSQQDVTYSWLNDKVGGSKTPVTPNDPFLASPNNKPNDPTSRENLREDLSDDRYGLTVPQAAAVDNFDDDQLESYRRNRDRGMTHREAYRESLRSKPNGRAKNK